MVVTRYSVRKTNYCYIPYAQAIEFTVVERVDGKVSLQSVDDPSVVVTAVIGEDGRGTIDTGRIVIKALFEPVPDLRREA